MLDFIQQYPGLIGVCIVGVITYFVKTHQARNNKFYLYRVSIVDKDKVVRGGFYSTKKKAISAVNQLGLSCEYALDKIVVNEWDGKVSNEVHSILGYDGDKDNMQNIAEYYFFSRCAKLDELCNYLDTKEHKENWETATFEINKNYYNQKAV